MKLEDALPHTPYGKVFEILEKFLDFADHSKGKKQLESFNIVALTQMLL